MSDESEWGSLEATFVQTLRETKIEPVPAPIIKLAQKSYDGTKHPQNPDELLHSMQLIFDTPERAQAFAKHMRNAGPHTNPVSSVTVVIDPERKKTDKLDEAGQPVKDENGKVVKVPGPPVNPCMVAWRAGKRRGRAS